MNYDKSTLIQAINHLIESDLGHALPIDYEYTFDEWLDILAAVSAKYFLIDDFDSLNTSIKTAFAVAKEASKDIQYNNGIIVFGEEFVEFLGNPLAKELTE